MKRLLCLLGLLAGATGTLCAQHWTPEDSLRLQRMLEGKTEIRLNPEALKELEKNFTIGQPRMSDEKPWLEFDETLPKEAEEVKKKKVRLTLRPYAPNTPYNWDPIRQRRIDIDEPRWKDNLLRGMERMLEGATPPSGHDFMGIFTKEFWNRKIKKRRNATLDALKSYGDSITIHEIRK